MKKVAIAIVTLTTALWVGAIQAAEVARAVVTTGVENREPVNDLTEVNAATDKIYFFTELRGMEGQTVKHRWSHNGEVMAEVDIAVGAPRWRVWSSKNLMPEWRGDWAVAVVNPAGEVLSEKRFVYAAAAEVMPEEMKSEKTVVEPAIAEPAEAPAPVEEKPMQ